MKLLVCYPSGAGGWWLSNLIHKLETNQFSNENAAVVNFHAHRHSTNVYLSHYPITPLDNNLAENYKINFTGSCLFNFYINVIQKLYIDSKKLGFTKETYHQDCHLLSCESLNKFSFPTEIDLNYDLIFTNQQLFIDNLFYLLDKCNIKYTKNVEICQLSMDQFKRSCPNPKNFYLDYDNLIWQGWCIGLIKYLKDPVPEYDHLLKDKLLEYNSKFVELSSNKILFF